MPYNKDIDKTLVELAPIQGMLSETRYHFRIKKYGKTNPKLEITKEYIDPKSGKPMETQRLGRIDISCLEDFALRIQEAKDRIDNNDL